MLVFFQSYSVMKSYISAWSVIKNDDGFSMIKSIQKRKKIFIESQNKVENNANIKAYLNLANTDEGAILFAVMNGKISEGIDFSDQEARGVLVFGIPFPAIYDDKVSLKKMYLDERVTKTSNKSLAKLTGKEWYTLSGIRPINQAIGRAIRHKDDFGSIFLFDDRLATGSYRTLISGWVRNVAKVYDNHASAIPDLFALYKAQIPIWKELQAQRCLADKENKKDLSRSLSSSSSASNSSNSNALPENTLALNELVTPLRSLRPQPAKQTSAGTLFSFFEKSSKSKKPQTDDIFEDSIRKHSKMGKYEEDGNVFMKIIDRDFN